MNDTVTKLMKQVGEFGQLYRWGANTSSHAKLKEIEAELTRLFTPLTDEQIESRIADKHFATSYKRHTSDEIILAWYRLGLKDGEVLHGITGENK